MNETLVQEIVAQVLRRMDGAAASAGGPAGSTRAGVAGENAPAAGQIPVEVSSRHVHLSATHLDALFGPGHALVQKRPLSQPGQFLSEERVRVIGPKGVLAGVAVLGPTRGATQVELSASDARALGVDAPVRMSGNLSGAADVTITAGANSVSAPGSVIVAKTHIHMTPADAARFGVQNGWKLPVRVPGQRSVIFEGVELRVDEAYRLALHLDVDEANACVCGADTVAELLCGKTLRPLAASGAQPANAGASSMPQAPAPVPAALQRQQAACAVQATLWGKGRVVISAEEAKALCKAGQDVILPKNSVVTPLARDVFHDAKIRCSIAE